MKLSKIIIYALLVTIVLRGALAQAVTSTSYTTTHPPPTSTTTITSEVEIIPTTNDFGQSITLTETTRLNPLQSPSSLTPQSNTVSSTTSSEGTASALSTSSDTLATSSTSPTSSTSSTSTCPSNAASPTGSGSADNCVTVQTILPNSRGVIIACAILLFSLFCICLYVTWWYKRKRFRDESEEDAAWWVHPIYNLRRLLPGADSHTPRRTERRSPPERVRPTISHPIPIYQPSQKPPPRPRERPSSLRHSLIGEMNTSPVLQSRSPQELAVAEATTLEDEKHRSLSPRPLKIVKNKDISGPLGRDLEANWPLPTSARSSTSNYSTPFGALSVADPSQPKPAYLPYRQPDTPPPSKLVQRGFLEQPSHEQHHMAREKLHQTAPFADEDEDDLELKQLRRDEALRMLEENAGRNETQGTFEGDEEDTKSPQSEKSFDFAGHRARHLLAEKKKREEFEKNRLANQQDHPPIPELPAAYRKH